MAEANTIDVSEIVENQKLSGFLVSLVTVSWIITFFDGFDMNSIGFVAAPIRDQYHISTELMGYVFSAGLVGTLFGGFLLGWIGDRIGRRPTVIFATAAFGAITMLFWVAQDATSLIVLRFFNGMALGGMLPLAWALNIEYAPRRYRATIVTVIMIGYSVGSALGGPIANWLIPLYGWKAVFIFGGGLSLVAALVLYLTLPESVRFLASKGKSPEVIAKIVRRIAPGHPIPANAKFVVADEGGSAKDFKVSYLFKGELRWITPMLWIAYIFSSMTAFFLANWGPIVMGSLGFTRADANWSATANSIGGALGGLMLMRFTDNRGAISIAIMPLIAIPLLLFTGLGDVSGIKFLGLDLYYYLTFLITLFLIGGHFGLHSIAGIFYPSAYRGNGTGWATSVAKIGSIAGPLIGGYVLASNLPKQSIFAVLAVCPFVFLICILVVGRIHTRILRREASGMTEELAMASQPGDD